MIHDLDGRIWWHRFFFVHMFCLAASATCTSCCYLHTPPQSELPIPYVVMLGEVPRGLFGNLKKFDQFAGESSRPIEGRDVAIVQFAISNLI